MPSTQAALTASSFHAKRVGLLFASFAVLLIASAVRADDSPKAAGPPNWLAPAAVEAVLDPYLRQGVKDRQFSGVVLVAQNGQPLFRRAYGYADWTRRIPNTPETSFMLFSNTKQFTAAAILLLQEQGLLKVSDKVAKYLPGWPRDWDGVLLQHLLSHSSGIEIDTFAAWIEDHYPSRRQDPARPFAPFVVKPLVSRPGEKWQYSNAGFIALGLIIESVSRQSFAEFVRRQIFAPLGMTRSDCDRDRPVPGRARGHELTADRAVINEQQTHFIIGAGDVYATVDDLLRWDNALSEGRFLSAAARTAMFTPHLRTPRGGAGYGWVVRYEGEGRVRYQHGGAGSGFATFTMRRPSERLYIAILCNVGPEGKFPYFDGCLERVDALAKAKAPRPAAGPE
jgi:CubicO group peptidase (beta-lactamase class C family)